MVLIINNDRGPTFENIRKGEFIHQNFKKLRIQLETLFELCFNCYSESKTMACIPPSAFCAKKVHENEEKLVLARNLHGENFSFQKHFNNKLMELTPLKYNSKLMNSIWGFYNRYSPHNIKRTNDDLFTQINFGGMTESSSNLSKVGVSKDTVNTQLPGKGSNKSQNIPNIDKIWHNIPISQSH